jgi:hypothetical protein
VTVPISYRSAGRVRRDWPLRAGATRRLAHRFSRNVIDRNEVDSSIVRAVDREVVDLSSIVLGRHVWVRLVVVAAGDSELDDSPLQSPGLALDKAEAPLPLDRQVVPRVLAERQEDAIPDLPQCQDDRERRSIADVLRMLDVVMIANTADGTMLPRRSSSVGQSTGFVNRAPWVRVPPPALRVEQRRKSSGQLLVDPRLADVVARAGVPDLEHALLVVVAADREHR